MRVDYELIGLIALMIAVVILATRHHSRSWPGRPGWQYQRVFSVGSFGLLLLVAGLIGWELTFLPGWFQGTRWVDGPIWWQIRFGVALLALAGFWARRVPLRPASR